MSGRWSRRQYMGVEYMGRVRCVPLCVVLFKPSVLNTVPQTSNPHTCSPDMLCRWLDSIVMSRVLHLSFHPPPPTWQGAVRDVVSRQLCDILHNEQLVGQDIRQVVHALQLTQVVTLGGTAHQVTHLVKS